MPAKKDDPLKATHFLTSHVVGPFGKGKLITAEELDKAMGVKDDADDAAKAKARAAPLKRLLDLGAITPAEAPEEDDEPAPEPEPEKKPTPRPEPKK